MSTTIAERAGAAPYSHSIAGCLDGAIGTHGLSQDELTLWIERLAPALDALQVDYRERRLPLLRIAEDEADIVAAEAALAKLSAGARAIIFFGTGGSSLGGETLAQLGGWNIPGLADEAQRNRPRTRFYDNLDPVTLESALGTFDLDTARFVVTSKSGGTPETLAQTLAAMSALAGSGPGGAHSRAVPRHHRAARRRQGQRSARSVRGARHPGAGAQPRHRRPLLGADQRRPAAGSGARPRCARGASRRAQRGGCDDGGRLAVRRFRPRSVRRWPWR